MPLLGSKVGQYVGEEGGKFIAKKLGANEKGVKLASEIGSAVGSYGGSFLPFKKGGMVKKRTQKALLHKGELVVPASMVKDVPKTLKKKIAKKGGRNM
jgi:hypothetical protein